MIEKGIYPYDFVNNYSRLFTTILPTKDKFYSKLNDEHCDDKSYQIALNVWDKFNCKTFIDYHNLYSISDVLLLSDVWNNFRNTGYRIYDLGTNYYYTAPSLSWDAFL